MNFIFYNLLFILGLFIGIVLVAYWIISGRNNSHHRPYTNEWYDIDDDHYNQFN